MLLKCEKAWGKTLEFPALVTINTGTAGPGSEELSAPPFTILDKKRQRRLTQPCCSRFKPWAVLGSAPSRFPFRQPGLPRVAGGWLSSVATGDKLWRNLILAAAVQFIDRKGIVMRWSAVPVKPMGSYLAALATLLAIAVSASPVAAATFTTLDDPLASPDGKINGTRAYGISGNNIVGAYLDSSGQQNGFLYDGTTYATLDAPLGTNGTYAQGISGSCIVGYYEDSSDLDHGFLYNGSTSTYTTLDDPLASPDGKVNGTRAYGISGSNIVGAYLDSSGQQNGFLYNGTSYTTLDDPLGTNGTYAQGICGNLIVGYYVDSSEVDHGFLYNRSTLTYTTLDDPLASPDGKINGTRAYGISGNNIVGAYLDSSGQQNGFLYDGTSYTTLDDPLGTNGTYAQGISGNLIVGYYVDSSEVDHAFVVPEPSTLALWSQRCWGLLGQFICGGAGRGLGDRQSRGIAVQPAPPIAAGLERNPNADGIRTPALQGCYSIAWGCRAAATLGLGRREFQKPQRGFVSRSSAQPLWG